MIFVRCSSGIIYLKELKVTLFYYLSKCANPEFPQTFRDLKKLHIYLEVNEFNSLRMM